MLCCVRSKMEGLEPRIESITGPMFCGKSEELIRRLTRHLIAGRWVSSFKPFIEDRYSKDHIVSHSDLRIPAYRAKSSDEISTYIRNLKGAPNVIGIDECQFFDEGIVPLVYDLANKGRIVILSYLDQDYRGEPFKFQNSQKNVGELLALSDSIVKLHSICVYKFSDGHTCGKEATRSQRLINGMPDHYDGLTIAVGTDKEHSKEKEVSTSIIKPVYEARCREHHIVPGKPY